MVAGFVTRDEALDRAVPVVDAVDVHAGGEQVGRPREAERGEVAAVGAAPQPDAVPVHAGEVSEEPAGAEHIAEFGGAARPVVQRFAEFHPVAGAAAVVHRQDGVAAARQVLVEGVAVGVIAHVVPAEQHLPAGAAVEEQDARAGFGAFGAGRLEQLAGYGHPVRRGKDDRARFDHRREREAVGERVRSELPRFAPVRLEHGLQRTARPAAEVGHAPVHGDREGFDPGAGGQRFRRTARRGAPEVAAVEVVLVRRDEQAAPAVGNRVLHLEFTGGEQFRLAASGRGHGVDAPVAAAFPREEEAAVVGPMELVGRGGAGEDAPRPGVGAEDLARGAGLPCLVQLDHANAPRRAFAPGHEQVRLEDRRTADEGEGAAVGREGREAVAVHRGIEIAERLRGEVVEADEGVRAPVRDQGEPPAVGGQAQVAEGTAPVDQPARLGALFETHTKDLAAPQEQHGGPVRGEERRRRRLGDPTGRGAALDDPERLLHAGGVAGGVGEFAGAVGAVAADEGDLRAVAAQGQPVDRRPVVAGEVGEAAAGEVRRLGRPDIAGAGLVEHPRGPLAAARSGEAGRKRRREDLFEGERGLGGGRRDDDGEGRDERGADEAGSRDEAVDHAGPPEKGHPMRRG